MIVGFSVANFLSFRDRQSCTFEPSAHREHASTHCLPTDVVMVPKLLKAAAIFGANASGKSNFFIALRTMRDLVLHSESFSEAQFAARYMPFLFSAAIQLPTIFEIDLLLGSVRYRYTMAYDARRVTFEELLVHQRAKSQRWFGRKFDPDAQRDTWKPFSQNFRGSREIWRKATKPSALFLTTAAQLHAEGLQPLLRWFEFQLDVWLPADKPDFDALETRLHDTQFKARVLRLLGDADVQVADIRIPAPGAPVTRSCWASAPTSGNRGSITVDIFYRVIDSIFKAEQPTALQTV